MTPAELHACAVRLTPEQVDKAAHALGWPKPTDHTWGRVKWKEPWRNYYCGSPEDADWLAMAALGVAIRGKGPNEDDAYWFVTPLGRVVVRLWLTVDRWARETAS